MAVIDNLIRRLSTAYSKDASSNLYLLFTIFAVQIQDIINARNDIRDAFSIDLAFGKTLDLIGAENDVARKAGGGDDAYRGRIKAAPYNAGGARGSIQNVVAFIVGLLPNEVIIEDGYTGADGKYGHFKIRFHGHTIEYDWTHLAEMVQFRKALGTKVDLLEEIAQYIQYVGISDSHSFALSKTFNEPAGIADADTHYWEASREVAGDAGIEDANNRYFYVNTCFVNSLNLIRHI